MRHQLFSSTRRLPPRSALAWLNHSEHSSGGGARLPMFTLAGAWRSLCVCNWSILGKWQQNPCHTQRLRHAQAEARTKLWRQEESIKASTRCQPLHAAKKRGDNDAHRVKQENEKQVNNTTCDTQKEANKRELRKWARKSGKSTGWSIKTLTEAQVPAWQRLILVPRNEMRSPGRHEQ